MGSLLDREALVEQVAARRRGGTRVAFTNGCFDLLHPGHIALLEQARSLADLLVVAVNSDAGVRALKGPGRPLVPEGERAELLAALQAVDYVTVFGEPTPRELIARLLPDVLVKGGDWGLEAIVGREEVEAAGGQVLSASFLPGYSTSALMEKVKLLTHH